MQVDLAYQTRTSVITELNASALDFATNVRRLPVSFRGQLREPVLMRQFMVAMHEVILGDYRWNMRGRLLDPVITVHPDELFFEAFSNDSSSYVRLSARDEAFDIADTPTYGTTNIDFTFALRAALMNMRSSRKTTFSVGAGGFGVETSGAARRAAHFEEKVDVPDAWVKGFLQVQSALAMKPFTFHVQPVDLLNLIHYFVEHRARKPPHGLRYEFATGEPVRAILEPWNEPFILRNTDYKGYPRSVRVWGRTRLQPLLRVLPYADKVTVGLIGRGLPHFYTCHCGSYKFTLVLSGWVRNDWSESSALDLLAPQTKVDGEMVASVYNALIGHLALKREEVEAQTLLTADQTEAALFRLCREGRAMYDPNSRRYRSRELFAEALNFDTILAPDPRIERAKNRAAQGAAVVHSVAKSDVRKNEIKILATVTIDDTAYEVLVAVDQESRIRFAQCDCDFFQSNLLNQGPCEHMLTARFAAEAQLSQVEKAAMIDV
jgi:hypothetical protein